MLGSGGWLTTNGHRKVWGDDGIVLYLIVMMVTWMHTIIKLTKEWILLCVYYLNSFLLLLSFCLLRAAPTAYGGSQARGSIGAVATGQRHSHSNSGSKPRLPPTPGNTGSLIHWARLGMEPESSWILDGSVTAELQ